MGFLGSANLRNFLHAGRRFSLLLPQRPYSDVLEANYERLGEWEKINGRLTEENDFPNAGAYKNVTSFVDARVLGLSLICLMALYGLYFEEHERLCVSE